MAQLLFLESKNRRSVSLYIDSPGGEVTPALAIIDTMRFVSMPVSTMVYGKAAGIAALIAACGARKMRLALPHARFMLTPLSSGARRDGLPVVSEITNREILRLTKTIHSLLSECTGRTLDQIQLATERSVTMSADRAMEFGLIDEIVAPKTKIVAPRTKP